MDFIYASKVSRTINASLTNGSTSSRDSARDTNSNEDIMHTDVTEVQATYQQQGSPPDHPQVLPETAPASAADAISEAEDEAPIMEALLLWLPRPTTKDSRKGNKNK